MRNVGIVFSNKKRISESEADGENTLSYSLNTETKKERISETNQSSLIDKEY